MRALQIPSTHPFEPIQRGLIELKPIITQLLVASNTGAGRRPFRSATTRIYKVGLNGWEIDSGP